ncbi:MAG: hypothetical protein IJQ87_05655 [Clostridia bacterium]|nr:hypothetical protein [Clostridia bacterium]
MRDFNDYAKNAGTTGGGKTAAGNGLFETVSRIAKNFDGKGEKDLLRAIFKEAEKNKRAGTLSNAEIDGFVSLLSPALDDKKRRYLKKIAEELKKI